MKRIKITNIIMHAAVLPGFLFMAACGAPVEPQQELDCAEGKKVSAKSTDYCVFTQRKAITEQGFMCPSEVSHGSAYGDLIVCASEKSEPPQELFDEIKKEFSNVPSGDCANVLCELNQVCDAGMCKAEMQDEMACLASCGDGCPAPEFQLCGEDGNLYCNDCVMGCKGVNKAADSATCQSTTDVNTCLQQCGVGCPAPEFQLCGEDGKLYCNDCIMGCYNVTKAADTTGCNTMECGETGIVCTPECPESGKLEGGAPCQKGTYNEETCSCE